MEHEEKIFTTKSCFSMGFKNDGVGNDNNGHKRT